MTALRTTVLTAWADAMEERRQARLRTQFLHEYWAAFEELLAAQRARDLHVWFLFDALREAHRHFQDAFDAGDESLRVLRRVWGSAMARRGTGSLEPLTASDIDAAVEQFARVCDALSVIRRRPCEILTVDDDGEPRKTARNPPVSRNHGPFAEGMFRGNGPLASIPR